MLPLFGIAYWNVNFGGSIENNIFRVNATTEASYSMGTGCKAAET